MVGANLPDRAVLVNEQFRIKADVAVRFQIHSPPGVFSAL